jgi:hypothetical protein
MGCVPRRRQTVQRYPNIQHPGTVDWPYDDGFSTDAADAPGRSPHGIDAKTLTLRKLPRTIPFRLVQARHRPEHDPSIACSCRILGHRLPAPSRSQHDAPVMLAGHQANQPQAIFGTSATLVFRFHRRPQYRRPCRSVHTPATGIPAGLMIIRSCRLSSLVGAYLPALASRV